MAINASKPFSFVITTMATTLMVTLTILSNSSDNWCLGMRFQLEGLSSDLWVSKSQPLPQSNSALCREFAEPDATRFQGSSDNLRL